MSEAVINLKTFFFTLAILSIATVMLSTNAYAETGQNFDREKIGPTQFKLITHYDRIWDGSKWVNYMWSDDGINITLESQNIIYKINKLSCEFSLLNPYTKQVSVKSFAQEMTVNGSKALLSACLVTKVTPRIDTLDVTVKRISADSQIETIYTIDASGNVEWTYDLSITNPLTSAKLGVIETCVDCVPLQVQNDFINFGDYFLDTKNRVHNTLKTKQAGKDYTITYEGGVMNSSEKLTIDPVFGYTNVTIGKRVFGTPGVTSSSCFSNAGFANLSDQFFLETDANTGPGGCHVLAFQWDISAIPDNSAVTNSSLRQDTTTVASPRNCDYTQVTNNTITATAETLWLDIINNQSGITYVSNDSQCTTVGNDKEIDLGTSADSDIEQSLSLDRFAVGMMSNPFNRDGSTRSNGFGANVELQVTYDTGIPDAITDLTNVTTRDTSVNLDWTEPNLHGGALQGYQVNYTTPYGNPLTVLNNNSGTTSNVNVTGLTKSTPYTFRVSAWTENGNNATGNKLNVTTPAFTPVNFTLGFIDVNVTNPDLFPIRFVRTDINATSLFLNVTYSKTFNLTCSFYYKFAMTNASYSNLSNVTVSSTEIRSDFQFVNASNEVVDVFCKDNNTPNNATYILTQTNFPLLAQFRNFTGGVYGTEGQFGTTSLIVLGIIILSMIGFNRVNPAVGAIFTVMIIFGAAWFGFINIPEIMIAAFILVVVLAIGTTRKDD